MAKKPGYNPKPYKGKYNSAGGWQKGPPRIPTGGAAPKEGCWDKVFGAFVLFVLISAAGIAEIFR